ARSAAVCVSVARPLEAMGVIVRTATDLVGARANLEDESSEDIDLVVVDALLPGLDVAAFAREVRALSRVARLVLLTPFGATAAEGDGGPDAVVSKPVRPSVFSPRVLAVGTRGPLVTVREAPGPPAPAVDPCAPLVLVVEDNDINRAVALRSLERLGYRATGARNGQEALEAFAGEAFAAVLMDCQMPVMDGYEAT